MEPVFPGFVRGGGYDPAPLAGPGIRPHHDRLPGQGRVPEPLDGDEEGIQVDVKDRPGGGRRGHAETLSEQKPKVNAISNLTVKI
jgi:hypothetical protein